MQTNKIDLVTKPPLAQLAQVPLSSAGVKKAPLGQQLADDAGLHGLFKYLVQCALPEGGSVTLTGKAGTHTFDGSMGIAPEWATGPCEAPCQEWVTACLLARTNAYQVPVQIYMRGPHPAIVDVEPEYEPIFDVEESAFYGNFFEDPPREYACRGRGTDPLYAAVRVCSQPGNRCGIQRVGPCWKVDGDTGETVDKHACEAMEGGAFVRCHNRLDRDGSANKPDRLWERVITVHTRRSSFAGGQDSPCSGGPEWPKAKPAAPGGVGQLCVHDDDCLGACVFCDARLVGGICTWGCNDMADPAAEAKQCGGPGSTCLSVSGVTGNCTIACTPFQAGNCPPGRVCTGHWLMRKQPDAPGCNAFCTSDADCATGSHCNRYVGVCGPPENPAFLKNGEPCVLEATGNALPEVPCRGGCFRVTNDPTQGICGSFVHRAISKTCPDDPEHITPQGPYGDELGLCVYRACKVNADCTEPLICTWGGTGGKFCLWPK